MKKLVNKNPRELSFTIFETIVAVGLLMAFTLEMAGGQGNIVNKVEYARRSNEAVWLAKRIMSQVEYNYQTKDLKELDTTSSMKDQKFEKLESESGFDYTYSIEVKEWKFPLFDFLLKGGAESEEEKDDPTKTNQEPDAAGIPGLDLILEQIFKGHILKIARVEVSWPDGARRDSVTLTYLLTNTKALDEYLTTKKSVFDGVLKRMSGTPPPAAFKGATCMAGEGGPGAYNEPGANGCRYADNTHRRIDGSIVTPDGQVIPAPNETPQTPQKPQQ
jgi:hypothetical protein